MDKRKLIKENLNNRDLFIVNIQPAMENRIYFDLEDYSKWIKANSEDFKRVFYFYNGESNEDNSETISELRKWVPEKLGLNRKYYVQNITELKKYFDGILESDYLDEDIITLGKYMLHKNYDKITNTMSPDEIDSMEISEEFKEDLKNKKFKFKIPYQFIESFKTMNNPYVCGGLDHSTLRMFRILLGITNTDYTQSHKWVF